MRGDDHFRHRLRTAALALGEQPTGPGAPRVLDDSLVQRVSTDVEVVWDHHREVVAVVEHLGPAISAVAPHRVKTYLAAFANLDLATPLEASGALRTLDVEGSSTVGVLRKGLTRGEIELVVGATRALVVIGHDEPGVRGALQALITHRNSRVASEAIRALAALSVDDDETIKVLRAVLGSGSSAKVASATARSLATMGADDPDTLNTLRSALTHKKAPVAAAAARALGFLGKDDPDTRNALRASLTHADPRVAVAAAVALRRIGSDHPDTLNALRTALNHTNRRVSAAAARALGFLGRGDPDVRIALRAALPKPGLGFVAAQALSHMGADDSATLDDLRNLLTQRNSWSALWAARALVTVDAHDEQSVTVLRRLLVHPNPRFAIEAAQSLADHRGNPADEFTIAALHSATGRSQPDVRWAAAVSLARLGSTDPAVSQIPARLNSGVTAGIGELVTVLGIRHLDRRLPPSWCNQLVTRVEDGEGQAARRAANLGRVGVRFFA